VLDLIGLCRRSQGIHRFGDFHVDLHSGELPKNGTRFKLQVQPFQVLQILLEQAGQAVTREELQKRIWPADTFVDFDHGLNNAVKKLREALADDADWPPSSGGSKGRSFERQSKTLEGSGSLCCGF